MTSPISVPCPLCGAKAWSGCSSRNSSYSAKIHLKRWQAVGVKKPTPEQQYMLEDEVARMYHERRLAMVSEAAAGFRKLLADHQE